MDSSSDTWTRWMIVGALCVTLTASIFALARAGTSSEFVYLPAAWGPVADMGGGTLENGGTVQGPDGVGLGALEDTLSAPIEVSIARATAPTTALPAMAQVVSEFYTLGAGQDVAVSTESPFIVAVPVPAGADTQRLALAVLGSGERVNDADPSVQAWSFLEGRYDPAQNIFLTTIAGLTVQERTIVLTVHPDFESPPNRAPVMAPARSNRPEGDLFRVKCVHFTAPMECTAAIESQVATFVTELYGHIQQNKGFEEPRLRYLHETLDYNPNSLSSLGYTVYIEPKSYGWCASLSAIGHYNATEGYLALCLDPTVGLNDDSFSALVHEYFHATQYAYQAALEDWQGGQRQPWIVEGMAMSAEKSYDIGEMKRSESGGWLELHKVDLSLALDTDPEAYFTQDFWVFHGQHTNQDLTYLQSVLAAGLETAEAADVLGDGERIKPYWEWVKNQAIEKQVTFDGKLQNPCQLEGDEVVGAKELFEHEHPDRNWYEVTVGPLTSVVVEISFSLSWGFASGTVYPHLLGQLPGAEQALEFKFYEEGEDGCTNVPDRQRTWPWGEGVNSHATYYVIISNTDIDNTYDYTVAFEYAD